MKYIFLLVPILMVCNKSFSQKRSASMKCEILNSKVLNFVYLNGVNNTIVNVRESVKRIERIVDDTEQGKIAKLTADDICFSYVYNDTKNLILPRKNGH